MIGLDTNVLLRLSDRTDPQQVRLARALVLKGGEGGSFVNEIVLAEYVWTLRRTYKQSRQDVVAKIEALLASAEIVVARAELVERALARYKAGPADFADYLLAEINRAAGCMQTATFDSGAQRSGEPFTPVSLLVE